MGPLDPVGDKNLGIHILHDRACGVFFFTVLERRRDRFRGFLQRRGAFEHRSGVPRRCLMVGVESVESWHAFLRLQDFSSLFVLPGVPGGAS